MACSCDPQRLPDRATANALRIIYDEPVSGWCVTPCCCPCVTARSYNRINEDSMETNRALYNVCCCSARDSISKKYYDQAPFRGCATSARPQFTSYMEGCYCCYCCPCAGAWDVLCKPFCGELLLVAPCYCDCFPRTFCVRCCSMPYMHGLLNSIAFAHKLHKAVDMQTFDPGSYGGPPAPGAGQTPKPEAVRDQAMERDQMKRDLATERETMERAYETNTGTAYRFNC